MLVFLVRHSVDSLNRINTEHMATFSITKEVFKLSAVSRWEGSGFKIIKVSHSVKALPLRGRVTGTKSMMLFYSFLVTSF